MYHDTLRALIVDDEIAACDSLRDIISETPDINLEIAGIAHNTKDAATLIAEQRPDIVFLDIDMPNENAFRFLERISPVPFEVIFVTAYDEYAVRAFRLNAADYILKPADTEELLAAVEKARTRIAYRNMLQLSDFGRLSQQIEKRAVQNQLVLRSNNHMEVVPFRNIIFVEAMRSYSRFVFMADGQEKEMIMSYPITEYETLLPGDIFFRIHRSYLVNRHYMRELLREEQVYVLLGNKQKLPVGRRRYADLVSFLKQNIPQDV